ncbi:ABC transporter ATP-binding protein [Bifidobacterium xylocopae]|uniref:Cobalt ABC transporter n=1 Tax=Bifidobacterium xylocopae TaxID=2493119 RepID=A0A366KDF5_9BIFI|nr:ABC transporter ATP-binding protein [Bifidobacterium xylocopae]RBP99766.1 cobalt ABC transporter [Bifidobacterium xylocopae]
MLELTDLSFTYADRPEPAVQDVSMTARPGRLLVLTGKSGCGKTTISRVVDGLIPELYEGRLEGGRRLDGRDLGELTISEISRKVGSVFQNPKTQFFTTDVTSELAFPLENLGVERVRISDRVELVADRFGIRPLLGRSMFALSGGEKQLVAIASACMGAPGLLVLDEPSANLDAQAIEGLSRVLGRLKADGMTLLVIEHRLYYLRGLADRFLVMDQGRLTHGFTPRQMAALDGDERERLGLRALVLPAGAGARKSERRPGATAVGGGVGAAMAVGGLRVQDLVCRYKGLDRPALQVDDLLLEPGRATGIVGRNGAGKSTFAKALTGLLKPGKEARVSLGGRDLDRRGLTRQSFLVFQDVNYQLFSESVAKELLLGAPEGDRGRLREVADRLGLADLLERSPGSLSGGQKQRVAIGCAVLSGKRVIIMDEPTSGLDLAHMNQVAGAIGYLRGQGIIVLVISHDREFLLKTCDRFIGFEKGRVVSDGALPPSSLPDGPTVACAARGV